jgi:YfiR/HmsC-like
MMRDDLRDLGRRHAVMCLLVGGASLALTRRVRAEEVAVPVARQAELLVRVAAYDRNLPARAAGTVRILILTNPDDADSRSVAAQMDAALRHFDKIAGLPYEISTAPFPGGAQVAAKCKAEHLSIVYMTQGLDAKVADLVGALGGVDVLSVAALARYVNTGVVLGFDLVSSKPTLVINLPQSKKQNVSIGAEVLHLMKVIE